MGFEPRPYQHDAIEAGVKFFDDYHNKGNAIEILTTGSGKSLVSAKIVDRLEGETAILQPSKEILTQNYAKFQSYGGRAGIYSASIGLKHKDRITYCTIGSIIKKKHIFRNLKHLLIDECHFTNPEDGMYSEFIDSLNHAKVLGLTATPYRLKTDGDGSKLEFLTRSHPRVFSSVAYYIQNDVLFNQGHLAPLEYYNFDVIDRSKLDMNAKGTDFSESSLKDYYRTISMPKITISYGLKILSIKRNLLIFCALTSEAYEISRGIPGSVVLTGDTPDNVRDAIIADFISFKIPCVINVRVLDTGFDFPGLEATLLAFSTMSLARYYQIGGRVMRPYTYADGTKKTGWIVDLGGNFNVFGKIETMKILQDDRGRYSIWNNGRQLTDISFTKN